MKDKPILDGKDESLEARLDALSTFLGRFSTLKPEMSAEEIEAKARNSVTRVMDYYTEQGIELGYVPRVKYTGESCRFNKYVLAQVESDISFTKNVMGLFASTLLKTVYDKLFCLQMSEETLQESIEVATGEFEAMFPNGMLNDDADIFLYKPVQNNLNLLDEYMAHEVWHLIEKKYGVLDGNGFIHEGTATYVQNRFVGRESEWRGNETDYFGMVYHNTAHFVQQEVVNESNPLKAILDTEKRKAIQAKFEQRVLPLFYEKAAAMIETGATKEFVREILLTHAAYEAFRKEPTGENLLVALRQKGYVKCADEISQQDITKLVEYYRELLNS